MTNRDTFEYILGLTGGSLLAPASLGAKLLGIAAQTGRAWVAAGKFPIPTVKMGKLVQVRVRDLADYIDGTGDFSERTLVPPRRPGRPRKYPQAKTKQRPAKLDANAPALSVSDSSRNSVEV